MPKSKFKPEKCGCCQQTTDYELALDRGTALIVLAIYNAVRKKGKNRVHLTEEMECRAADYASYREMVEDGKMTSWMKGNVLRAKYHGLVAQVEGGGLGEYLITPKGAEFLRNKRIPRTAIINKVTHTKKEYWDPENDTTTFTLLLKKETPFWDIKPFEIEEVTGTFRTIEPTPQATLGLE